MAAKKKRAWSALKWSLFGVVLFFVASEAGAVWQAGDFKDLQIQWAWLIPSAVLYLLGWLPSVWFWRAYMVSLGHHPSWMATIRAYYCGHLGKYVPGKATALVIRAGLLKSQKVPLRVSAVGATLETLGVMGIGLAITLSLAAWTLPLNAWKLIPQTFDALRTNAWLGPVLVAVGAAVAIPLLAGILTRMAEKLAQGDVSAVKAMSGETPNAQSLAQHSRQIEPSQAAGASLSGSNRQLLTLGSLGFVLAWFAHGLSLGCVIIAIGEPISAADILTWTGVVSGATAIGFFVLFAPGGLGVREALLITVLAATLSKPQAIAAAALLRVVWFTTELATAAVLSIGVGKQEE